MKKIKESEAYIYYQLLNSIADKEMPGVLTMAVVRNIRSLEKEYKAYAEAQAKTIKKYAKLDENGNFKFTEDKRFIFEDGKDKECDVELTEIGNAEIEVEISEVPFEVFEKCNSLTPKELFNLDFMIKK